jgi:long-chain acyl-CoA synthetase
MPAANFLDRLFAHLRASAERAVIQEIRSPSVVPATGAELLAAVRAARTYLRRAGVRPSDRCALLAPNSIRWAAVDLALMAERVIVVPLYSRQAPAELAAVLRDCQPRLVLCGDAALAQSIEGAWPAGPRRVLFDEVFAAAESAASVPDAPEPREPADVVTIIYTSGTSGEAKGVCLSVANLDHMLACTTERLDQLMGVRTRTGPSDVSAGRRAASSARPDAIFHYLPWSFAGSWILLLTALSRFSVLSLSTDLSRLADEIRVAAPDYFQNVPMLLERIRRAVDANIAKRGGIARAIFTHAWAAWKRGATGSLWFWLARILVFPKIRAQFGPNLEALICGSAPLATETQQFFLMLGIPVLQAYGLTETTGVCTVDDPRAPVEPGFVGPPIAGIEMKLGENEEVLVRGPNVFPGYWNRPEETAQVLRDGWFYTGDQGEVNTRGNWRIIGRLKNLIILNSGHNIAPEPIEEHLLAMLPAAQHIVLVGNGRGYLTALVTGAVDEPAVRAALDAVNPGLPHYKQVRGFSILRDAFTIENGLLTTSGKLRRDAIAARFAGSINELYRGRAS